MMTDELRTTATELVDLVQAKVGTTSFATAYSRIRIFRDSGIGGAGLNIKEKSEK